jgi:two-component sensor histidine kinase
MQVLQSLLASAGRSASSEEARRVLNEASGRIAAMAAAQRVLYGTTDASRFTASDFLRAVTETVRQTLPPDIDIVCAAVDGVLGNDAAMPLALIVNELVTNAAKHGVKNRGVDSIRVGLIKRDDEYELYVEDDGFGFDLDAVRHTSSGLRLVLGLARQLRANFEVSRNPCRASLRFPAGKAH